MIYILSQDGARMINAEQVSGYEIKERRVYGKPYLCEYDINALFPSPCYGCVLGIFTDIKMAKDVIKVIGETITRCVSGNKLIIIPTELDVSQEWIGLDVSDNRVPAVPSQTVTTQELLQKMRQKQGND